MAKKPDPLNALLAASFRASEPTPVEAAPSAASPAPAPLPPVESDEPAPEPSHTEEPSESKASSTSENAPVTRKPRAPRAAKAPEPEPLPLYDFEGVKKTTVSFYAAEQAKVDEILDTLLKVRRHRGGFSDAIKIALRLCPIDPQSIATAWDSARASDKRTQRSRGFSR
jgi:hypothetical protein